MRKEGVELKKRVRKRTKRRNERRDIERMVEERGVGGDRRR